MVSFVPLDLRKESRYSLVCSLVFISVQRDYFCEYFDNVVYLLVGIEHFIATFGFLFTRLYL